MPFVAPFQSTSGCHSGKLLQHKSLENVSQDVIYNTLPQYDGIGPKSDIKKVVF